MPLSENRFRKLTETIREALNRAAKTSEMLELDNPPSLGTTVNEFLFEEI